MPSEARITLATINAAVECLRGGAPELSAQMVAAKVAVMYPDVPLPFLRMKAAAALHLLFMATQPDDIDAAIAEGIVTPDEAAEVLRYLAHQADAHVAALCADDAIWRASQAQ